MKRLRRSYPISLALALMLLGSMLFGNWSASALTSGSPAGAAQPGSPMTGSVYTTAPVGGPFMTIQQGINFSDAGGTVNVSAGVYEENLVVNKAITIAGAGQGSTIVYPAVSGPNPSGCGSLCVGASSVFLIQSSNVTIHDLTVDGDNPNLTANIIDARNGIITNHTLNITYNNLEIYNTTVKNIYLRGIYASTGGTFNIHNNTVDNVQSDPGSIGIFNWVGSGTIANNTVSNANDAIAANHSSGTHFQNNTVTTSGSGVHTDNAGDGGGTADLIEGNNVSACATNGYGVWDFVPYIAPTIRNNTVTGCAVGMAAFGQGGSVTTLFDGNTVTGSLASGSVGAFVTTDQLGFGSNNVSALLTGNKITGWATGVVAAQDPSYVNTTVLHSNDLSGNTAGVNNTGTLMPAQEIALPSSANSDGARKALKKPQGAKPGSPDAATLVDASGNWWGSNIESVVAGLVSANVDYTPWLNTGTDTAPATPGFQGDFSYLNVSTGGPQVGTTGRIQEGVNSVASGGTVNVLAGTYTEQVDIETALTLHGAGQGSTIIDSPTVLATMFTTGSGPKKPIVFVHATGVVVQNLTVDGLSLGSTNDSMVGIGIYNAGGTIDHTTIVNIKDNPLSGMQRGVGIYAYNQDTTPRTLNVDSNTIHDYQKNGMALNGVGLTANVTNNTVTGAGNTTLIAQNGIQIGFGGTGTITGNTVSGNFCSAAPCIGDPATSGADGAAGILLYSTSNPAIIVANNVLTNNQYGVWSVAAPALSIQGNTFSGAGVSGIPSVGVSIWNGDGSATPQGTTGTINGNTFNGLGYGLIVRDYVASPQIAMSGHSNSFLGNTLFGAWSNSTAPVDLSNNWWNASSGPSSVGPGTGDHVSANINFSPWLLGPSAYAHLQPTSPITVTVGTNFTLDLFINSGGQSVIAQQSYMTFPVGLLQNVNVTQDSTSFPQVLQNVVNNGTGEIAYASSVLPNDPNGVTGDFAVAHMTFAANAIGDATVRWQFSPPDPANRNSKIVDHSSNTVSDPGLYQDYVIHIVPTATATPTDTPTATPTDTPTVTPTSTPTTQFTGHVIWQGRPAQPNARQVLPISLTLIGTTTYNFPGLTTDASGNFTVNVDSVPNGTYTWRVKGPQYLSTSGSVVLSHAPNTSVEMGEQLAGDANNDNLVDVTDFGILHATFATYNDPRADFNGDLMVEITDFSLLAGNFGQLGNLPGKIVEKQADGSAVLELRPQGKGPANGGTVHVGDSFTLELWVNAQAGTSVVGQQSYLTFPANQLQLGNQKNAGPRIGANGLLTPDSSVLETTLQNAICNGSTSCVFNGQKVAAGSLAFASGTLSPVAGTGAFRVATVTVQATAAGTAHLHWQFGVNGRDTKIVTDGGVTVSQPDQFVDYVLNVLPAGK